jgi:UPF0755 protein
MNKPLLQAAAVIFFPAMFAAAWLVMDYLDFIQEPLDISAPGYVFEIAPGSSMRLVANKLHEQGVINKPRYLAWHARNRKLAEKIRAGEYLIPPGVTVDEMLDQFVRGDVIQYSLTLVEGWNFRDFRQALAQSPHIKQTLADLSDAGVMRQLGKPDEHPEGRFFPDTYVFPRNTTDVDILQQAYQAMAQHLQAEWEQRSPGLPLETPYEALILASIIEKETGLASERPMIGGVFIRRLQKGMRLQTDPTVIYGMGEKYDGNIRRRDLQQDTPYNTYTRHGLTPTPIAMPGLASIRAALQPAEGTALYFVGKGDGSHHFSDTLDEHNRAVIRYQLKGKKRAFSSMPGG